MLTLDGSFLPGGPHGGVKGLLRVVQLSLQQDGSVHFGSGGVQGNLDAACLLVLEENRSKLK